MSVRTDAAEAAEMLRRVVVAVSSGELSARPRTVARLEGAVIALEAVAQGETFDVDSVLALFDE